MTYLALLPAAFPSGGGDAAAARRPGWQPRRCDKPFGEALDGTPQLNELLHRCFPEDAVFRIDHFLGLQTVQNLLTVRFANRIFESLWNGQHVEAVEIT